MRVHGKLKNCDLKESTREKTTLSHFERSTSDANDGLSGYEGLMQFYFLRLMNLRIASMHSLLCHLSASSFTSRSLHCSSASLCTLLSDCLLRRSDSGGRFEYASTNLLLSVRKAGAGITWFTKFLSNASNAVNFRPNSNTSAAWRKLNKFQSSFVPYPYSTIKTYFRPNS